MATPVQVALPELLRHRPAHPRRDLRAHAHQSLHAARRRETVRLQVLPVEGGWSAVVRVPRVMSDDELALALLDRGVVVQPGYFFDFAADGYVVVSLLTREEVFGEGVRIGGYDAAIGF